MMRQRFSVFFFNDTATTEIYTLSLHDALPIWFADVARYAAMRFTANKNVALSANATTA